MWSFGLLALVFLGSAVNAQQPSIEQIRACSRTLVSSTFQSDVDYSTNDNTPYNASWTYDIAACTQPAIVPIIRVSLTNDYAGQIYQCPIPAFTNSGTIESICTRTHADLAEAALEGDTDWIVGINLGVRTTYSVQVNQLFVVTGTVPPTPSGNFGKRKRAVNENLQCGHGQSWCRTNTKAFECIKTSSDLTACGACPYDDNAVDCTNIEGADNVECRRSSCYVKTCLRGYQVSPDRKSCISNTRKLVAQKYRR